MTVASGGTLYLAGFNQTVAGLTNTGLVNMGTSTSPGTVLTTANYVGQGGAIAMNTFLGADGSRSDRLVINGGAATGNSFLRIANAGGAGALTTGNGILLIDTTNGGTTAAGAFGLGNRTVAGPYEYTLFRSSIDASNPQAWYLRSTLDCTLAPNASVCAQPSIPPTSPSAPPTPPTVPHYRAETSLYATLPSMVLQYGRNLMDTLHERIGEERPSVAPADGNNPQPSLGWARIITLSGSQFGSSDGILSKGPQYNYGIDAFQGGIDLYRAERADGGSDHAGIYTAIGQMSANVTHLTGLPAGSNTLKAYTLGGYWTRFSATGWYLDAVTQYTWNDLKAAPLGISGLTTQGGSFAASLETGKPFQLGAGYSIEPQAQLIYQTASLAGSADSAASVAFNDVDSLAGRLGARFARSFAIDPGAVQPHLITAWVRPSVWYEFLGNPTTSFSSATGFIPFRSDLGGSWGEIAAGFDVQVARNTSFYTNLNYQIGFNGRSDAYGGKFGARVAW
ncbi:autotransporter outer membrane beta-barrel domain-containing protein [Bradyrhizobium genosp. P]|uniref:autotransporter family protein n=1 Tax=Bradyrhizobium genosp. P TaxID=83641 RepID=UPI003CF375DB